MSLMSVFWILIPLFIGILFIGLYRNLLVKLAVIFGASGCFIPLRDVDAAALGQACAEEVLTQKRIRLRGRLPWTRHMLISWGFSVLFGFDILTALFTKYVPLEAFQHEARFNSRTRSIEMHLRYRRTQRVTIAKAGFSVEIRETETIWTETSHKYTLAEVDSLARKTSFRRESQWVDPEWPFAETLLVAV